MFRFPSNGKAYINCESVSSTLGVIVCFDSLQTGKHISTRKTLIRNFGFASFDSLQTGKHISTAPNFNPVGPWLQNAKTMSELRGAFFDATFCPKIPQTRVYIELCAIFSKNTSKARHRLLSWAIFVAFISDHLSRIGFVYNYTSLQVMLSNFFI